MMPLWPKTVLRARGAELFRPGIERPRCAAQRIRRRCRRVVVAPLPGPPGRSGVLRSFCSSQISPAHGGENGCAGTPHPGGTERRLKVRAASAFAGASPRGRKAPPPPLRSVHLCLPLACPLLEPGSNQKKKKKKKRGERRRGRETKTQQICFQNDFRNFWTLLYKY